MKRFSAGLIMYRIQHNKIQVLLAHPGGPFWAKKDLGVWSIPKGEYSEPEHPLNAAQREFHEETGLVASGPFIPLTPIRQKSGKLITAWAFEGDCDTSTIKSNTFHMEWPLKSGKDQEFPEIDRAGWFDIAEARRRILPGQIGFLDELCGQLGYELDGHRPTH